MKAIYSRGDNGDKLEITDIPDNLKELASQKRAEMVEKVAEVDDEVGELFLMDEEPTVEDLIAAIRRSTIANIFVPVYMGSAFKNKGVQPVLDAVTDFLPQPVDVQNFAREVSGNVEDGTAKDEGEKINIASDSSKPLIALAFKLEESRFGQLTYMRVYQGTINRGDWIFNSANRQKLKVPRIVRMHSDEMQDIESAGAGEIFAMFGVECASGDTFTHEESRGLSMESMFVPQPVMSLAVEPAKTKDAAKFGKALKRFTREDPTFRRHMDEKTGETIISGMGELHLQIYIERMRREYDLELKTGAPRVSYTEQIAQRAEFNYTHKKQTGGQGMYAKVQGFIEPLPEDSEEDFVFENRLIGTAIPNEYFSAIEAGFRDAAQKGPQVGGEVQKMFIALEDGASHQVDSSELAFRIASALGMKSAFEAAQPQVLEPVMAVEVHVPSEFTANVLSQLNQKKGMITDTSVVGQYTAIKGSVPLQAMFGYSSTLRSATQGKGEFTMEYLEHQPVTRDVQARLMEEYQESLRSSDTD
jgi:elongation factor G